MLRKASKCFLFCLVVRYPLPNTAYKDATQFQATVKEYWRKYPNASVGLLCDGLLVLDFDGKARAIERLRLTSNPSATQSHLRHKSALMTMRYLKTLNEDESLKIQQAVDFHW